MSISKNLSAAVLLGLILNIPAQATETGLAPLEKSNGTAISTYYYSLPLTQMINLVKQDNAEKRIIGSKVRPSLLEPYMVAVQNVASIADGNYAAYSQADGKFVGGVKNAALTNSGYICVTFLTMSVPKRGGAGIPGAPKDGATNIAKRFCGNTDPGTGGPNYANWQRNDPTGGLRGLYSSLHLQTVLEPNTYPYRGQLFHDQVAVKDNSTAREFYGISFFDQTGATGLLQEILIVTVEYK